jgi:hypothetical protein
MKSYSLVKKRTYHARAGGWRTDNKISWIPRDISLAPDTEKYQVIKDFEDFEEVVKYFCNAFLADTFSSHFDSTSFSLWAIASNKLKGQKEIAFNDVKIVPVKDSLTPDTKHISFKLDQATFYSLVNGVSIANPQYTPKVGMSLRIQQLSDFLFNSGKQPAPTPSLEAVQVDTKSPQINSQEEPSETSHRAIPVFKPELAVITGSIPHLNSVQSIIEPEFSERIELVAAVNPEPQFELPESKKVPQTVHTNPVITPQSITPTKVAPVFSSSIPVSNNGRKPTNKIKKSWFGSWKKFGVLTASIVALIGLGYVADQGLKNLEQKAQTKSPIIAQQNSTGNDPIKPVINQPVDNVTLKSLTEKVIRQDERICSELNNFPDPSNYSDPQWFRLDSSKFYSCAAQMLTNNNINSRLPRLIEFQERWLDSRISIDTLLKEAMPVQL